MVDDFYSNLQKCLDDWQLRGIFADWCFDNNEPQLEKAQRFMIEHKVHALPQRIQQMQTFMWGRKDNKTYKKHEFYKNCLLPHKIFELIEIEPIRPFNIISGEWWKVFSSLKNAEFALGKVL